MSVRSTRNQTVQIGPEVTPGTAVAAGKILSAFTWSMGGKPETKQFTGSGHKYPSASELLSDSAAGKISGPGDFAALIYPFSSVFGTASPALSGSSTTAYDWVFTPPIAGAATPQTYTVQVGDAIDAEQYAYVLFTGCGYSFTRKQELTITGDWFSQALSDGITKTSSPTSIATSPMTGAQFNVYLDSTSGGLGTTKLTDPLKCDFAASGYYGQYWPINRSNASFSDHVDMEPKNDLKVTLQANSTAIAVRSNYLDTGTKCYLRVQGVGPVIDSDNSINATFTHDMAAFVSGMGEFSDVDGVYAVEYTFTVAEDAQWSSGTAQILTLTNLISAL